MGEGRGREKAKGRGGKRHKDLDWRSEEGDKQRRGKGRVNDYGLLSIASHCAK